MNNLKARITGSSTPIIESAREEPKELDRAGANKKSSDQAATAMHRDVSTKSTKKGHTAKDFTCTRYKMCYRCRQYENHTVGFFPYSDDEISKDFKYKKPRGNLKNNYNN